MFICMRGEEHRFIFSIGRMCRVMSVISRGLRAISAVALPVADSGLIWSCWRTSRNTCASVWAAMRCTAVDCTAINESGRPRMTEELKEVGLKVGHRRVGCFLLGDVDITCQAMDAPDRHICCQNTQTQAFRTPEGCPASQWVTSDSNHKFNIAPHLQDRNFAADGPNQKCPLSDALHRLSGNRLATSLIYGRVKVGCILL